MRTIESELRAFHHYWRTKKRAESTFEHYAEHIRQWHAATGLLSPTLDGAREYLLDLHDAEGRWAEYWATRALKAYAAYLAHEPETVSKLKRLKIPEMGEPVNTPTATEEEIDRLLQACSGRDIWSRRDHAIISVLRSTGARRSEHPTQTRRQRALGEASTIWWMSMQRTIHAVRNSGDGRRPKHDWALSNSKSCSTRSRLWAG